MRQPKEILYSQEGRLWSLFCKVNSSNYTVEEERRVVRVSFGCTGKRKVSATEGGNESDFIEREKQKKDREMGMMKKK